jgi:E3 ubiquitin-protein ligase listerin
MASKKHIKVFISESVTDSSALICIYLALECQHSNSFLFPFDRYSGGDSSDDIRTKLIVDILAKIVWRDYLLLSDGTATCDVQLSHKKSVPVANTRYPMNYLQDLGKCIIEILDVIADTDNCLLDVSCESLLRCCLDIIQQGEKLSKFQDHVEQLVSFFLSLDRLVVNQGKTWPLEKLARPLVEQSLSAIKSLVSSDILG